MAYFKRSIDGVYSLVSASGGTRACPAFSDRLPMAISSPHQYVVDMTLNQIADEISLKMFYAKLSSALLKKLRMISKSSDLPHGIRVKTGTASRLVFVSLKTQDKRTS